MTVIDTGEISKVRKQDRKAPQNRRWGDRVDADLVTGYRRSLNGSPKRISIKVPSPFPHFAPDKSPSRTTMANLLFSFEQHSFFYIPDAALSAVIMVAVSVLISPPSVFIQFYKVNLWDFLSSQVALWVTIFVSVETGIAAGVAFSLVVLLFRVARPNFHVLRQIKDRPDVFIDASLDNTIETVSAPHGVLVFRIEESTTFPNSEAFKTWVLDETYKYTRFGGHIREASEKLWSDDMAVHVRNLRKIAHGADSNVTDDDLPKLRAVVLDFSAVNSIDSTGLQGLFDLRDLLKDYAGVTDEPSTFFEVHFVGIQSSVLHVLEMSGITRPIAPIALQKVEVLDHATGSEDEIVSETDKKNHTDIGSAAVSVLGQSPFLKEAGLVHLTVRDAIDSVLIRSQVWERDHGNKGSDSGSINKTDIHYV